MRRLAYADPPYPGSAWRYPEQREVNHPILVNYLRTFDGWALSTSAAALRSVWDLCPEARCAAWLKPWATNGWSRVRWTWEPLLFVTDRRGLAPGERSTVRDGLYAMPTMRGFVGAKPPAFADWLFELLDVGPADELTDIFPGSGAITVRRHAQPVELPL